MVLRQKRKRQKRMIRKIDSKGNILGSYFVFDAEQVKQDIECQLQLFAKENPYDLGEGIDYPNELSNNYIESRLRILIRDRILSVKYVTGLSEDVVITRQPTDLLVTAVVITEFDQTVEVEIPIYG